MKKYVIALSFLIVQNMCAMELTTLLSQDNPKALRFAKLFNKYPNGYGEDRNQTDLCREAINYFLDKSDSSHVMVEPLFCKYPSKDAVKEEHSDIKKQKKQFFRQFESLSSRVKQYQTILNNIDAVEILDFVHKYLPCDRKSEIFTAALHDHAQQYYAISNALRFVILEPYLAFAGYYSGVVDVCSPAFLAELHENDKPKICFSDDCFKCELYCVDRSLVKAYSHPNYTGSALRLKKLNGKPFASELIAFVSQDSKKARIDAFKILFASWVEYLVNETNKEKYMSAFVELLKRLNWHDITLWDAKDCEKVLQREDALNKMFKS